MGLFENLFGCICQQQQQPPNDMQTADEIKKYFNVMHTEMKGIANAINSDIKYILKQQGDTNSDLKRLEDKIANNILALNSKLDNMILISSRNNIK